MSSLQVHNTHVIIGLGLRLVLGLGLVHPSNSWVSCNVIPAGDECKLSILVCRTRWA